MSDDQRIQTRALLEAAINVACEAARESDQARIRDLTEALEATTKALYSMTKATGEDKAYGICTGCGAEWDMKADVCTAPNDCDIAQTLQQARKALGEVGQQ